MSVLYLDPRQSPRARNIRTGMSCGACNTMHAGGMGAFLSAGAPTSALEWVNYLPTYKEFYYPGSMHPDQVDIATGLNPAQIAEQKRLSLELLKNSAPAPQPSITQTVIQTPTQTQASGQETGIGNRETNTNDDDDLLAKLGAIFAGQQPAAPSSVNVSTGGETSVMPSSPMDLLTNKWVLMGAGALVLYYFYAKRKR